MDTGIISWFRGVRVYEHYEPQFPQFGTPMLRILVDLVYMAFLLVMGTSLCVLS